MAVPVPDAVKASQDNWRFCDNCFSLWWNGDPNRKGVCNAFDREFDDQGKLISSHPHVGPSWDFFLLADPDAGI